MGCRAGSSGFPIINVLTLGQLRGGTSWLWSYSSYSKELEKERVTSKRTLRRKELPRLSPRAANRERWSSFRRV